MGRSKKTPVSRLADPDVTPAGVTRQIYPEGVPTNTDGSLQTEGSISIADAQNLGALTAEAAQANKKMLETVLRKQRGETDVPWNTKDPIEMFDLIVFCGWRETTWAYIEEIAPNSVSLAPVRCTPFASGAALFDHLVRTVHKRRGQATYRIKYRDTGQRMVRGMGDLTIGSTLDDPELERSQPHAVAPAPVLPLPVAAAPPPAIAPPSELEARMQRLEDHLGQIAQAILGRPLAQSTPAPIPATVPTPPQPPQWPEGTFFDAHGRAVVFAPRAAGAPAASPPSADPPPPPPAATTPGRVTHGGIDIDHLAETVGTLQKVHESIFGRAPKSAPAAAAEAVRQAADDAVPEPPPFSTQVLRPEAGNDSPVVVRGPDGAIDWAATIPANALLIPRFLEGLAKAAQQVQRANAQRPIRADGLVVSEGPPASLPRAYAPAPPPQAPPAPAPAPSVSFIPTVE